MAANKNILTINAGSSSIKLDVFVLEANESLQNILHASVNGIGQTESKLIIHDRNGKQQPVMLESSDFETAVLTLFAVVDDTISSDALLAIGHRIVHGGPHFSQPSLVTDELLAELETVAHFDPEHTPAALELMRRLQVRYPDVEQVACFDNAFFHNMPRVAQTLPIPRRFAAQGLRRYGFHGLSYQYVQSAFRKIAGETAADGRVIYAHLGSGASVAATLHGNPIDTTMGFSPSSGIIMSSRTGDIDPGITSYLLGAGGMQLDEFTHMINFESGLLGVSELSADMYTLLQHEANNHQAAEAVNLFIYDVRKAIGALATTIGGLDSLIFTGGIGEQSAILRKRICDGLAFLGVELDETANHHDAECISSEASAVGVHVIATDEALVIAKNVHTLLSNQQHMEEE